MSKEVILAKELVYARDLLRSSSRLKYLFQSALNDLELGLHGREFRICSKSMVMRSLFNNENIFYTVGEIDSSDMNWILSFREKGELHCHEDHQTLIREMASEAHRLLSIEPVKYYVFRCKENFEWNNCCRKVESKDIGEIKQFIQDFNKHSIFFEGLLKNPAVGIWEGNRLIAYGGTLFINTILGSCQIGNFLTHPEFRGRGLARIVAKSLMSLLYQQGLRVFRLEVYSHNRSAQRVYESLGFEVEDLAPMAELSSGNI